MLLTIALGLLAGLVLSRANFCLMRAARESAHGDFTHAGAMLLACASAAAAYWAAGFLFDREPTPWAWPGALVVVGAALFGVGARINAGCTIGTMTRLGHGDVGALATVAGAIPVLLLVPRTKLAATPAAETASAQGAWTLALAVLAAIVLARTWRRLHLKEIVVPMALGAVASLLYARQTELDWGEVMALAPQASSQAIAVAGGVALIVGVFGAAAMRGRFSLALPRRDRLALEFVGGALMAAGALTIPGASDAMLFHGVPSGSPHAIVAAIIVFATIALTFRVTDSQAWRRRFGASPDIAHSEA